MTFSYTTYELVIIEKRTRSIVVSRDQRGFLPTVDVDGTLRPAYAITHAVLNVLMVQTFLLVNTQGREDRRCAILELLTSPSELPDQLELRRVEDVMEMVDGRQLPLIISCLDGEHSLTGRFARVGWLAELELRYWAQPIEHVEQVNCGVNFSLFRFSSNGVRYWFKATGDPNTHEFALTRLLSELVPQFVPRVCLAIDGWNAWIANDVEGQPLSTVANETVWSSALEDLFSLQELTQSELDRLRIAGARDLTIPSILEDLSQLFGDAERAMKAQTSTRTAPLSSSDLQSLQATVRDILQDLHELGIGDYVVHADLGSGNVLVAANGTIFLDWAETYIGNPFISSEHMLAGTSLLSPDVLSRLREEHVHRVCPQFVPRDQLFVAARIQVLGPLAAAMVAWRHGRRSHAPERYWPALRSLLRHVRGALMLVNQRAADSAPEPGAEGSVHA
jgi:hypothetical protein